MIYELIFYVIYFTLSFNLFLFFIIQYLITIIANKPKPLGDTGFVQLREKNTTFIFVALLYLFYAISLFIHSYHQHLSTVFIGFLTFDVPLVNNISGILRFLENILLCIVANSIFEKFYTNFHASLFHRLSLLLIWLSALIIPIGLAIGIFQVDKFSDTISTIIFIPFVLYMVSHSSNFNSQVYSRYQIIINLVVGLFIVDSLFGFVFPRETSLIDTIHMTREFSMGILFGVIIEKETSKVVLKKC